MAQLPTPTPELVADVKARLPQLRELRTKAGLSLEEVAERLGVSFSAVSRWETGDRSPSGWTASALSALMDDLEGLTK